MDINKDLKKIALCIAALALGSAMIGAILGVFAYSQYYVPPIEPQWLSRLTRLKIDGSADVLTLEAEGYLTQTTNIFEVQQSDSDIVFSVSNDGNVLISGTLTISDAITFAGNLNMGDNNITNVGDIALDTISADDGSSFAMSNNWTNAANTIADLGTVTTADINGGTMDDTVVGGSSAAAGSFTTLIVTSTSDLQGDVSDSVGDFTVADNAVVTGTLNVQGAVDFDSTLDMSNQAISNIGAAGTDFSGTGGLTLADALTISSGGANVTGDIDGSAEFQVGTWLNLTQQTVITVTNGTVFTPTGTYQLIIAASEVTPTISTTGFTTGDQLELHNAGTPVINFEATGVQYLKDDYPMDQYDVLGLRWNGTGWVELYRTGPRI